MSDEIAFVTQPREKTHTWMCQNAPTTPWSVVGRVRSERGSLDNLFVLQDQWQRGWLQGPCQWAFIIPESQLTGISF